MKLKAPEWFVKEMAAFDPDLRVRWSAKMNIWQLERKIARSKIIDTTKKDTFDDDYIRAKEGYLLVALIEPGKFSRNIFTVLRSSDLWTNGGWRGLARFVEEQEAQAEEKLWENFSDELKAQTQELYNFLKIRDGRTIFNIGHPG